MTFTQFSRSMLAVLAFGALALGGTTAWAQDKPTVRLLSGPTGGAYYVMGAILADALYRSGTVAAATSEGSSGGLENGRRVGSGDAQFGMMDVAWVNRAKEGVKPFKRKFDQLRTAVPLFVTPMFFVTPADSSVRTFDDMRGKRVAVGARSSGMENHARRVLGAFGWTFDDIKPVHQGFAAGGQAMRAGRVDVQLQCCIPNGGFTELTTLSRVRVVGWKPGQLDKVVKSSSDYGKTVIKKGAFRGHDADAEAIALFNGVMTNVNTDEQTVYLLAKTMISNLKEMAEKSAQFGSLEDVFESAKTEGVKALEVGVPLHPGSIRAFKEAGILQ